jgi:hypothetical protein
VFSARDAAQHNRLPNWAGKAAQFYRGGADVYQQLYGLVFPDRHGAPTGERHCGRIDRKRVGIDA